jgi:hypothetical protein
MPDRTVLEYVLAAQSTHAADEVAPELGLYWPALQKMHPVLP